MAAWITVRYRDGAKRAAGAEWEALEAAGVGELRAALAEVDVRPPFAGGC